jgi:hypothetical protein
VAEKGLGLMKESSREAKGRFYTLRGSLHDVNLMHVQGACVSQLRRDREVRISDRTRRRRGK